MILLIFCTDQFSTSLAGLWVCSNERAPTTPLQQSIRGIIEFPHLLSWRACVRALEDPWVHIPLSLFALIVITCSVVSFCCSFLLGLNILTFNTPCARCYYFFSHKRNTSHLAIDSLTHTHTLPKIRLCKTILEFLLHDIPSPIVVAIFWTILLIFFFFFWLPFLSSLFPLHDFLTTRKRKFAPSEFPSPLFISRVCSSPDTMAHVLSISFQLRHD